MRTSGVRGGPCVFTTPPAPHSTQHLKLCVCVRANVYASVRALAHPGLPESVPEYIMYRGHPRRARTRTHTHTERITQTSIIYAAFRSVGGNLISPQAGNLELRERGTESHWKFPQVGPAPISLIRFAAALKTINGREESSKRVGLESKGVHVSFFPSNKQPRFKWGACLCWGVRIKSPRLPQDRLTRCDGEDPGGCQGLLLPLRWQP